jgi:uncharacterized membrane protein
MKKIQILAIVVGVVQLILGLGFLVIPGYFLSWMGLSVPPTDVNYMLGMLAARFLAYGFGMFYIAKKPKQNIFWIKNMILVQIIDLAVGLFYTLSGTITLAVSAFPMFNASVFIILLFLWTPKTDEQV